MGFNSGFKGLIQLRIKSKVVSILNKQDARYIYGAAYR